MSSKNKMILIVPVYQNPNENVCVLNGFYFSTQ